MNENENYLPQTLSLPEYVKQEDNCNFTLPQKIFSAAVILLAFLFVHLVLFNTTSLFTTFFYIILITAVLIFMKKSGVKFSKFHVFLSVVLYLFTLVFFVTANEFIKFLNVIFLLTLGSYLIFSSADGEEKFSRFLPLQLVEAVFKYPFANFGLQSKIVKTSIKKAKFKKLKAIIKGLVMAIPLTLIVWVLLCSADSRFSQMMKNICLFIPDIDIWTITLEIIISIPIGCCIYSAVYSSVTKENIKPFDEQKCEALCQKKATVDNMVIYSFVTPICILYTIFFISQIEYFTSAFLGKLPREYSFAQYARKGFFELFALELINAAVIFIISFKAKKNGKNKPLALKIYIIIISLYTLLITATAISKMIMYIDNYGFTQLRVYTIWFMLLTAAIFIFVIIKQFKTNFKVMSWSALTFFIMFFALCFSRPDAFITKYNLTYKSENMSYADLITMSKMSDDACGVILSDEFNEQVRKICSQEDFLIYTKRKEYANEYSKENVEYTPNGCYEELKNICLKNINNDDYAKYNISGLIIINERED